MVKRTSKKGYVNLLDYEFNEVGFDKTFRLMLIETKFPKKLTAWFDQCPVLAISRLKSSVSNTKSEKVVRYVILMDKRLEVPDQSNDVQQKLVALHQAFKQGITDDMILLLMMKSIQQCRVDKDLITKNVNATDRLLLIVPQKVNSQYRAVIEVKLKDHILQLISRAFISVESEMGYIVSKECLKWVKCRAGKKLTDRGINNKKQLTDFFSIKTLNDFDRSKLGFFDKLLEQVGDKFNDCFDLVPAAHFSEIKDFTDKTKVAEIDRLVARYSGKCLNFILDMDKKDEVRLFSHIKEMLLKSDRWQATGGIITSSEYPQDGLNIQILNDRQDTRYLCSEGTKYIQHITFEKFGRYDSLNDEYHWNLTDRDIMTDPKFQTTLYQTLIKKDILTGKLSVPTDQEIAYATPCHFFMFKNLSSDKNENKILVTRLKINKNGEINLISKICSDKKIIEDNELSQVAKKVLEKSKVNISGLVGAISFKERLFLIKRTDLITVPNIKEIKAQIYQANGENMVERQDLLNVAQSLRFDKKNDVKNQRQLVRELAAIDKAILSVQELPNYLTLTWRHAVLKQFNDCFYKLQKQWLHLPVRQRKYDSYWIGTYGMGLIELEGKSYYFVGRTQLVELKQARAVPLKEIVAVDSEMPNRDISEVFSLFKKMMQVGFVRLNQYTVIPFPFKYVREYLDLVEHREKRSNSTI